MGRLFSFAKITSSLMQKSIRRILSMKQWTLREVCALVGVSRQTISQIERGDYSPSVTLALKIAKVFGVNVEEIFWYEEESVDNE